MPGALALDDATGVVFPGGLEHETTDPNETNRNANLRELIGDSSSSSSGVERKIRMSIWGPIVANSEHRRERCRHEVDEFNWNPRKSTCHWS